MKVEKNKVIIKPIAGTRLKEKGKENEIKEFLLSDPKELAEHLMLLDLGRNDVGRVSKNWLNKCKRVISNPRNIKFIIYTLLLKAN